MYPTDAELIWWAVAAILGFIFMFIVVPLANKYHDYKESRDMFAKYTYKDYHDDMEDWR